MHDIKVVVHQNSMSLLRVSSLCYSRTCRELESSEGNEVQLCDTELIQQGAFISPPNPGFLSVFGLNEPVRGNKQIKVVVPQQ